jgi:hypothetical protein
MQVCHCVGVHSSAGNRWAFFPATEVHNRSGAHLSNRQVTLGSWLPTEVAVVEKGRHFMHVLYDPKSVVHILDSPTILFYFYPVG